MIHFAEDIKLRWKLVHWWVDCHSETLTDCKNGLSLTSWSSQRATAEFFTCDETNPWNSRGCWSTSQKAGSVFQKRTWKSCWRSWTRMKTVHLQERRQTAYRTVLADMWPAGWDWFFPSIPTCGTVFGYCVQLYPKTIKINIELGPGEIHQDCQGTWAQIVWGEYKKNRFAQP